MGTDPADDGRRRGTPAGGYVTLVVRIWVVDDGTQIRARIRDAHSGAEHPIDLSALAAFLRASLAQAAGGNAEAGR